MMFARLLEYDTHTRRFVIRHSGIVGWEATTEQDGHVQSRAVYEDWHRVEGVRRRFNSEILRLEEAGWREWPGAGRRD